MLTLALAPSQFFASHAYLHMFQNFTAVVVSPALKPPPAHIPFVLTSDCVPRSTSSASSSSSGGSSNVPVITMTAGDTCTVSVTRTDVHTSPLSQRDNNNSDSASAGMLSHPAHDHLWARLRGPSIIFIDLNEVDAMPGFWTADVSLQRAL
jgi:hypothetical protein